MPGSDGLIKDDAEAVEVSNKIGFPVMIKATAGGGGRGMRLAMHEGEFMTLLQQATQVLSQNLPSNEYTHLRPPLLNHRREAVHCARGFQAMPS